MLAKILADRGENADLAKYWAGFGLSEGARATEHDIDFWIGVLERDGSLPKGKLKAADLLLELNGTSQLELMAVMSATEAIRGEVAIRDLSKSFAINGRPLTVLKGLNLDIRAGECLVIVGASGSGKTTLLRVLAGLEAADGGRVLIDGEPVRGVGTERAVIFQEPRLLPWLTVLGNVAFGLEVRGQARAEAEDRARDTIGLVGLERLRRRLSPPALRRHGAARRHRPRAHRAAGDPAARRAARRARRDDQDHHAGGARPHLERGERHHGHGHP